jgi:hypothetical protein
LTPKAVQEAAALDEPLGTVIFCPLPIIALKGAAGTLNGSAQSDT